VARTVLTEVYFVLSSGIYWQYAVLTSFNAFICRRKHTLFLQDNSSDVNIATTAVSSVWVSTDHRCHFFRFFVLYLNPSLKKMHSFSCHVLGLCSCKKDIFIYGSVPLCTLHKFCDLSLLHLVGGGGAVQ
jgi:hypothetical protein